MGPTAVPLGPRPDALAAGHHQSLSGRRRAQGPGASWLVGGAGREEKNNRGEEKEFCPRRAFHKRGERLATIEALGAARSLVCVLWGDRLARG